MSDILSYFFLACFSGSLMGLGVYGLYLVFIDIKLFFENRKREKK